MLLHILSGLYYLLETKKLRHNDGGFLINFKPPHKVVTSTTTAARWVVNILKEAGVNVFLVLIQQDQQLHQKPMTKV